MTDQPAGYQPPQPAAPGVPPQGQPQQGFGAAPAGQAGFGAAPGAQAPGAPAFGAQAPGAPAFGAPAPGAPAFGAPGAPAFGAPGSYTPVAEEPKKGGGKGRLAGILGVVGVVAVGIIIKIAIGAGVGVAANALAEDPTKDAKVGQCIGSLPELAEGERDRLVDVGVVDCNDTDAESVIVGRVDNLTLLQAQEEERCMEFIAEGRSGSMVWPTEAEENKFYVLCLEDK